MAKKILFINEGDLVEIVQSLFGVPVTLDTKGLEVPGEEDLVCEYVLLHPIAKDLDKVLDKVSSKISIDKKDILTTIDSETGSTIINIDYIDLTQILGEKYNTTLSGDYDVCECNLFSDTIVIAFTIA